MEVVPREEARLPWPCQAFAVGCAVRVKPGVTRPQTGWGPLRAADAVGRVVGVHPTAPGTLIVNFPRAEAWKAAADDLEVCARADAARKALPKQQQDTNKQDTIFWRSRNSIQP